MVAPQLLVGAGIGYWLAEYEARNVGVAGITAITLDDMDRPDLDGGGYVAFAG